REGASAALGDAFDEVSRRLHGVGSEILEVRARGERAARVVTRQDRAADLVVVLHGGEMARETLVEIGAPRVARLGTTQGDDADGSAPLERDGHACLLPPRDRLEPPSVSVAVLRLSTEGGRSRGQSCRSRSSSWLRSRISKSGGGTSGRRARPSRLTHAT